MIRLRALLVSCVLAFAPAAWAQERIDLQDLRIRSEAGDRAATRALAEAYYLGRGGVEQDFAQAAQWYRRLATQGDARAQTSLGLMYARGLGFDKNMAEARRWWSLAAAQNDAGAQYNLGMVLLEGDGTAPDPKQAHFWLTRAAQRGHVLAQTNLGVMHLRGDGTVRDEVNGLMWLMIAADAGEDRAQSILKDVAGTVAAESFDRARARLREKAARPTR